MGVLVAALAGLTPVGHVQYPEEFSFMKLGTSNTYNPSTKCEGAALAFFVLASLVFACWLTAKANSPTPMPEHWGVLYTRVSFFWFGGGG